eukprot:11722035-Alexandrium_andersonii.AAC.1
MQTSQRGLPAENTCTHPRAPAHTLTPAPDTRGHTRTCAESALTPPYTPDYTLKPDTDLHKTGSG